MKQIRLIVLSVLLLIAMILLFVACGDDDTSSFGSSTDTTLTPTTSNNSVVENPFDEKDPWNSELSIPNSVLTTVSEPGKKLFSGLEWTGKTNSKDANGKTVNQSAIVSINEVDYHSNTTIVYKDLVEAYQGATQYAPEKSSYYQLLTGEGKTWQLAVYKNETLAKNAGLLNFYKTDYDMSKAPKYEGDNIVSVYRDAYYGGFKDVTLPASWVVNGFDFPIYSNTQYPWDNDAYGNGSFTVPVAPSVTNPVGFYRTTVDVDPEWIASGRRIYISFQGVESAYYLYVNGYEVGYSEDSFDASDFDITAYLNKDGKDNLIAVKVYRWCDGSYFENQDYVRLAGIFRDVFLYSLTGVHIADYKVVTDLDAKFTNADLDIKAEIYNSTTSDVESDFYSLDVRLVDAKGNSVFADDPFRKSVTAIKSGTTKTVALSKKVTAPHLWSDEDPYLYTLIISLYDKNGVYYGSISQQLGFREISFTPTRGTSENSTQYQTMLLNGKPLFFRGVNRHDSNPETGRYMTREIIEKDIQIMKQLNVNAVRTSHYPNDRYLYDMCDKYGILVMGECNIETHYGVNDTQTTQYFNNVVKDRVLSHSEAYKNRTSVVMWSIGNETNGGAAIYPSIISTLKKNDPTRPVHFESLRSGGGVDVSSTMYSSHTEVANRANAANKMPYVICEYAHAMGNSVGHLYEYGQAFRSSDVLIGGFIWDFVDQAVWTPIPSTFKNALDYYNNGKFLGYGGTWGDAPNSGNFCQNGIISSDRTLQPETAEVKYVYQYIWFTADVLSATDKTISIYNEHRFLNLSDYDFSYELLCNGKVIDSGSFAVSAKPGETVSLEIPYKMPTEAMADGEYCLNLFARLNHDTDYAKKGYVVASEQLPIFTEVEHIGPDVDKMGDVTFTEDSSVIKVTGKNFELSFKKASGEIDTFTYGGEEIFVTGPVPSFTRARNDNDKNAFAWDTVTAKTTKSISAKRSADGKTVTVDVVLNLSQNAGSENVTYTIYGDGQIKVSSKLNPASHMGEMYRFGAVITLPSDYEDIVFYGEGPEDGYNDRRHGVHLGIWNTTVTDSFFPYPRPQDTGTKVGVRYFGLTSDKKNTGILIVAENEVEASALHYSIGQLKAAKYPYLLRKAISSTYLSINYGSRGTGGASCGPDTLADYRLYNDGRDYSYTYTIVPFEKEKDDIDTLYRLWHDAQSMSKADIDQYIAALVDAEILKLPANPHLLEDVRAAYKALTEAQKEYIKNYGIIEAVEKAETSTTILKDQSSGANTGKLNNGIHLPDNTSPNGYAIDGYFLTSDNGGKINSALSGTKNFTVGAFLKMEDLNSDNVILAKGDTQVTIKIQGGGMLEFFVYRGNWDAIINVDPGSAGLAVGEWCYVVGVRDGSQLRLYVNGKLVGTANNASGNVSTNGTQFGIGADPSMNRYGRSSYAYAHVLPFAATEEQIKTSYEAFKNGTTPAYTASDSVVWYDSSKFEYQSK